MTNQIKIKTEGGNPKFANKIHAWVFGHEASITFGPVEIFGNAEALATELRRLAKLIEPGCVKQRHDEYVSKEMPEAMVRPETAWPWLVKRFPWLFEKIDVNREPYARYLKTETSNNKHNGVG